MKIHSMIDVITNSSTEIYTFMNSNAKEQAYELLNEILEIALGRDTTVKAEDLFDITIKPNDFYWLFDSIEDIDDLPDELIKEDIKLLKENFESKKYKEKNKYFDDVVEPYFMKDDKWKQLINHNGYDEPSSLNETSMIIMAKNKERSTKDIMKLFFKLFHQEACYNG